MGFFDILWVALAVAVGAAVHHRPAPANQFDPSRYRGPGAPPSEPPSGEAP